MSIDSRNADPAECRCPTQDADHHSFAARQIAGHLRQLCLGVDSGH
jgi:hypothetical protein